ncbi:Fpg/Nei family DNA glycosylase [Georgenia thermotolerans]|uniref:DNA-(apurinic or apyrimidinic site) lyase n=1 Tax=Georgenia thermotolerans TaxID=527326 RepID=A0A7J5UJC6_9MICO|nr:DNA-formamidopyrimidine glycosylase family protein [Georgenia thermotolerans]KAE8762416.1 Fpg/Nei family DNA glycosylase [Georgenia thermotolerans]
MPEGDIVVRVARRLDAALAGQVLTRGELRWADLGAVDLAGVGVVENATRGKHLLTRLDDGRTLHTHLRMEGVWRLVRTGDLASGASRADRNPYVRAVLGTARWTCLGINLGMVDLVPTAEEARLVGHLGPDLLAPELDADAAAARILAQDERGIAEVLLDQTVVAGLGTIYMAETLWTHRVWPWTPAGSLDAVARELVTTGRRLMRRSADARLPTATGDPRRSTNVHGRERRPCPRCGTPIARGKAGTPPRQRSVYYCPSCQRRG